MRAHAGDADARAALVEENLPLVSYVARRFADRGAEYEDLYQYGCMGLLKAIDHFDPAFDVRFSTYAVPVILGEMRRFLRDDGPIHVSRTLHDRARAVARFTEVYRNENGREPTLSEIARNTQISPEEVALAIGAAGRVRSLDEPVSPDGEICLRDTLGTDEMSAVDGRLTLKKLLSDLPERDRALIVRRYFQAHTQSEIARDMGISQVQVSRLESRILSRLRSMAGVES